MTDGNNKSACSPAVFTYVITAVHQHMLRLQQVTAKQLWQKSNKCYNTCQIPHNSISK